MTDEDWIEYEQHRHHFDEFYQKYQIQLSSFPLTAIRQLVQQLINIIPEILVCAGDQQSDYHDLILHIICEIANQNEACHQMSDYNTSELNQMTFVKPVSREDYCNTLSELCTTYLQIQDFQRAGAILLQIYLYSAHFIYMRS